MAAYLKVTLKRSGIGGTKRQRDTLRGLGLRRLNQSNLLQDTKEIRGLINKVNHLIDWQATKTAKLSKPEKINTYVLGEVKAS